MNDELRAIFEADQADRKTGNIAENWEEIAERDRNRHERVEQLIASGALADAADYYHAAMVFQHGQSLASYWQAHELAKSAAERGDSRGKWLAAAAYDRWLTYQGKPQKYGTQYRIENGRRRLLDVDPSTTDAERAEWDVPSLATSQRMAEYADRGEDASPALLQDPPLASVEVPGLRVEIKRWIGPLPPANRPQPTPEPVVAGEVVAPDWLPPDTQLARLEGAFCAIGAAGEVVVSWRRYAVNDGRPFVMGWFDTYGPAPSLEATELAERPAVLVNATAATPAQVFVKSPNAQGWLVTSDRLAREDLLRFATGLASS